MDNEALMAILVSWARDEARVYPTAFDCRYYDECNASVGNQLQGGAGCLMSYVGRQYGSSAIGEGFRLVIVGIDHGEPGGGTFEDRRNRVENDHQNEGSSFFRAHYKGLVRTAAAVFGRTGNYCRQRCTKACQKSCDPDATSRCVIDRITQPNLVKCTRRDLENANTESTGRMMANCARHLASELKRLQPGLVVVHGAGSRKPVVRAFVECGLDMEAIEGILPGQHGPPILYKSEALGGYVLFLYHPSSWRYFPNQWETVDKAALDYLRSKGLIPSDGRAPAGNGVSGASEDHHSSGTEEIEAMAAIETANHIGRIAGNTSSQGGSDTTNPPPATTNSWSDGLKARTRDAIEGRDILRTRNGHLHLKHVTSAFGTIAEGNLTRGVLRVVEMQTGAETHFANAEELIAAGWVVD